jgi:ABC-type nitrate/sulfonate/bicarbonate transport system substrate-binding protein
MIGTRSIRTAAAVLVVSIAIAASAGAQTSAPDVVHFVSSGTFPSPLTVHDITTGMGALKEVEKQFNTQIDMNDMAAGPTAMAALLGGSVDFLVTSGNAFSRAAVQGQPVIALMELSKGFTGTLVAPKSLIARGTGLAALKKWNGGTWGVASVGGIAEFGARRAAEDAGLKWADQNVVYTGSLPATATGVAMGRLDIGQPDDWTTATLVANDQAFVVVNLADLKGDETWNHQIGWVLAARKETVEKYPELTKAIVRAELRGLLRAKELKSNPNGALQLYAGTTVSPKAFAVYWELNVPCFERVTGLIEPQAVNAMTQILRGMNAVKPDQEIPADAFNDSYVRAAYQSLNLKLPQ